MEEPRNYGNKKTEHEVLHFSSVSNLAKLMKANVADLSKELSIT